MTAKNPTAQGISRLLKAAAYDRSETISRATLAHRYTAGFHVRAAGADEVYVGWRPATPPEGNSAAFRERHNKARALELTEEYAGVLRAAGWPAEVIHLAGPLVRVTAREA